MPRRKLAVLAALVVCVACSQTIASTDDINKSSTENVAQLIDASVEKDATMGVWLESPFLVTSLGQGVDATILREMLEDLNADFVYQAVTPPEEIKDYKAVVLAIGSSANSLKELGLTAEAELLRCKTLLESIPPESDVIIVRLGDSVRQDSLITDLLDLSLPKTDLIMLTKTSDQGGSLQAFTTRENIPCHVSDSAQHMREQFGVMLERANVKESAYR